MREEGRCGQEEVGRERTDTAARLQHAIKVPAVQELPQEETDRKTDRGRDWWRKDKVLTSIPPGPFSW